jgi:HD superfamily phosphodiesterase
MLITVELSKEQIKEAVHYADINTVIGSAITKLTATEEGAYFDKKDELVQLLCEFQKFAKEYKK